MLKNVIVLTFVGWLVGCSLLRHNTETATKTLQAIATTVHHSMEAAADLRVAGKIDDAAWGRIVELKLRYEKAMAVAVATVSGNMNSWAPNDVEEASSALVNLILTFTK